MRTVDIINDERGTTATLDGKPALLEDAVAEWNRQHGAGEQMGFSPAILAANRAAFERAQETSTTAPWARSPFERDAVALADHAQSCGYDFEAAAREDIAVAGAATLGPWVNHEPAIDDSRTVRAPSDDGVTILVLGCHGTDADMALAARARASVPERTGHVLALCAAVRDLTDDLAEARSSLASAERLYQSQSGEVTRLGAGKLAQAYREVQAGLDRELDLRAQLRVVETGTEGVWRWQGDGEDHPESLSCPVVMSAETLRALLARIDARAGADRGTAINRSISASAHVVEARGALAATPAHHVADVERARGRLLAAEQEQREADAARAALVPPDPGAGHLSAPTSEPA